MSLNASQASGGVPADLAFVVVREGREVGTHTVRFRAEAGLLRARSEVRIVVRLAGIPVFRYSHDTEEAWRGDRLVALDSRLDNNGRPGLCEARAEAAGLRLRGTAGEALLPPIAAPLTWWRAATFAGGVPLFDPRHGLPVSPELRRRPEGAGQRVVQRDVLLQEVWGYNATVTTHTLETHIYRLRQKIEPDVGRATILMTDPGGYRLEP
jgi:hypothetical protein